MKELDLLLLEDKMAVDDNLTQEKYIHMIVVVTIKGWTRESENTWIEPITLQKKSLEEAFSIAIISI